MRFTRKVSKIPTSPNAVLLVAIFSTPATFGGGGSPNPLYRDVNTLPFAELRSKTGLSTPPTV